MNDMAMFRQMFLVHWKTLRWPLAGMAVLGFALPLLATHGLAETFRFWAGADPRAVGVTDVRMEQAIWRPLFPLLAAAIGSVVALGTWYWDHRDDHVYALALPLERWRYVLLKLATGGALLALVVVAFGVGAVVAAGRLEVPAGFETYPLLLTLRFLLAVLTVYALLFALAAGTVPSALKTLVGLGAVVILFTALYPILSDTVAGVGVAGAGEWIGRALSEWPGPFEVLVGEWALVDV